MPNLHKQFKDALLSATVAIPSEGESVVSNIITLHEGRKAQGQEIEIQFPKLLNLATEKRIRVWLEHTDTCEGSVDSLGRPGFPGGVNPPDEPPSKPPKQDPKPDPETPKDPKKDPKKDPEQPENPEDGNADSTSTWERALNVGLAVVTGPQLVATAQYLAVPVDIKKFIRAVVSVDKGAGNNTGLVTVSLVF
jgi:hypothetical protein